jgi:UV DNA damage endonuclease
MGGGGTFMKIGLCCISLDLQDQDPPLKFQTMTFKRFSSLPREEAVGILGDRIHNNLIVTAETIRYCANNDLCYRLSSDLFPLITYDAAGVDLTDLPNHDDIQDAFDDLESIISETKVRVSCHPSEFNVLASTNKAAVDKTIDELNFYSSFMDRIGCPADHNSPKNLHVHNKDGSHNEIVARFLESFGRLDENCQKRLVIENDDKLNCWSVKELVEIFHAMTGIPITFDYLHHKCNPNGLLEQEAFELCHQTWAHVTPLFHYSESRPGNNPRAHADFAENKFELYKDCDIDFELKMKDKAISKFKLEVIRDI